LRAPAAEVEDTCNAAVAAGGQAIPLLADIGNEDQVRAVFAALDARFGRLDFAANCAGFDLNADFLDYTAADFDRIFAANVKGLFLCLQQEILAIRRHGDGGAIEGYMARETAAGHPMTAADLAAGVPLRRIASPEDIANVVLFLCSAQAASITGAVLAADGGFVLA
jgi:NAD(P)-dependent dehydrogenase (short-subunit alcohol dehydrogenase family)